ncbi:hypothetical protein ACFL3S_05505 [Gemmatimonadota bacterium]
MTGNYVDVLPHSRTQVLVLFHPSDPNPSGEPTPTSLVVEWEEGQPPRLEDAKVVATRIVSCGIETLVMGRLGRVMVGRAGHWQEETIEGPQTHGFLCDAQVVGQTVVAVGMDRQVYRRSEAGRWQSIHEGILDQSLDVDVVTGFRSIDGGRSGDLYAVGLRGEIGWYHNGDWGLIEAPTNVILEQVRVSRNGRAMAVGQAGTILAGSGRTWRVVEQTATEESFWGLEWFNGSFYLATQTGLFRFLDNDELEPLDTGGPQNLTFCRLRATHDSLWSVGPSHLLRTSDGQEWLPIDLEAAT